MAHAHGQPAVPIAPAETAATCRAEAFYRHVMQTLDRARVPFLIGGTYAFRHFTGIHRQTKDLDVFVRRASLDRALAALARRGAHTELTHPHFLGKASAGERFVDVIFSSGNGTCEVDDWWFAQAPRGTLLGRPVRFCPIAEMIWSKAYVMERERYDGHDVAHLLRVGGSRVDWSRLVARFGSDWHLLLAHLVLFQFIYPGERDARRDQVVDELVERLRRERPYPAESDLCRGTLLSRSQYRYDLEVLGLRDARLEPVGSMTADETARWTAASPDAATQAARPAASHSRARAPHSARRRRARPVPRGRAREARRSRR